MSDSRTKIAELIRQIKPFDAKEQEHIEDVLDWISSGVEIFRIEKPATPLKHLVSYSVLVDFKEKKNLRLLEFKDWSLVNDLQIKRVSGGMLLETPDLLTLKINNLRVVTKKKPSKAQMQSLIFAWKVAKHVKSNAIVTVRETNGSYQLLGIGAGQPNRLNSIRVALEKTAANLQAEGKNSMDDVILFSDAFFPFEDNVELSNQYGIKIIVQPGGSIRDKQVIGKCDQFGISMIFTGTRHFKH